MTDRQREGASRSRHSPPTWRACAVAEAAAPRAAGRGRRRAMDRVSRVARAGCSRRDQQIRSVECTICRTTRSWRCAQAAKRRAARALSLSRTSTPGDVLARDLVVFLTHHSGQREGGRARYQRAGAAEYQVITDRTHLVCASGSAAQEWRTLSLVPQMPSGCRRTPLRAKLRAVSASQRIVLCGDGDLVRLAPDPRG